MTIGSWPYHSVPDGQRVKLFQPKFMVEISIWASVRELSLKTMT